MMGEFAVLIGVPSLAGPFILSATAFILAGLVLFIMLRPDPLDIAKRIAAYKDEEYGNKIGTGDKTKK